MAKWVLCSERLPEGGLDVPVMVRWERGTMLMAASCVNGAWEVYGDDDSEPVAWLDEVPEFEGE